MIKVKVKIMECGKIDLTPEGKYGVYTHLDTVYEWMNLSIFLYRLVRAKNL